MLRFRVYNKGEIIGQLFAETEEGAVIEFKNDYSSVFGAQLISDDGTGDLIDTIC